MDPVNEGLYGVSQGRQHSTEEISLVQTAVGGDSKALAARQRCDHAGAVKSKCASGQDDTQHTVCSGRFPQIFSRPVQHLWFVGGDSLAREPRVHEPLADAITKVHGLGSFGFTLGWRVIKGRGVDPVKYRAEPRLDSSQSPPTLKCQGPK